MRKTFISVLALILAILPLYGVSFASADSTYVDKVDSFLQGDKKNGDPVDAARRDPNKALGAEDGAFVSLGYGGELVVSFHDFIGGNLTITAYETTFGSYPEETADVYVSDDGINFDLIGTADNLTGQPADDPHPSVFDLGDMCIKYVKLVDTTDPDLHNDTSDGFDVDAVRGDYDAVCCPADDTGTTCCQSHDIVMNTNEAVVMNEISVRARTGGNEAGGSYGGNGGNGGNMSLGEDGEVEDSSTGGGGTGGNGAIGGTVTTGDATAIAGALNVVNDNRTLIDRCACQDASSSVCSDECGHTITVNRSRATVANGLEAEAETGGNDAEGSYGGNGGNGGGIAAGSGEAEDSYTGMGANGGSGSDGGLVTTGAARSISGAINVVNRSVTRITR